MPAEDIYKGKEGSKAINQFKAIIEQRLAENSSVSSTVDDLESID